MKATVQPLAAEVTQDRKAVLAEALRRRIMSMELAPGAVVDELALCDEFGLSRPPVRELLRQIAAEGYIELEANRAPRVAAMNHESLHSFYVAAPLIYVATTQLAATYASAEEIEVLKAIQAQFRQAIERRDPQAAGQLVRDHFELSRRRMAEYAAPQGLDVPIQI